MHAVGPNPFGKNLLEVSGRVSNLFYVVPKSGPVVSDGLVYFGADDLELLLSGCDKRKGLLSIRFRSAVRGSIFSRRRQCIGTWYSSGHTTESLRVG